MTEAAGVIPPQDVENRTEIRVSENQPLADSLTRLMNSEGYLSRLQTIDPAVRRGFIGATMEYGVVHPDLFEIDQFFDAIASDQDDSQTDTAKGHALDARITQAITDSIARKLHVDPNTQEGKDKIFAYYYEQTEDHGVLYHGFNGIFEDAIQADGLQVDTRHWDWEDLQRITEIGTRAGYKMLVGWGKVNSEGKIYFTESPDQTYRYAVASPEWFAQFTAEGGHVKNEPARKEAYYRRDYETARQNVVDMCDELQSRKKEDVIARRAYPNITDQERQDLLDLFEKYWSKFAGEQGVPKVALIDKTQVYGKLQESLTFDTICREVLRGDPSSLPVSTAIETMRGSQGLGSDQRTSENIPPDKIAIVTVPDYNQVFPKA